ncbi:low molecular weight phosphatase family protein [Cryobacterium suzukii]|uniref:Low molecular weight phosphatase family protein n=1 Tax=Cryobacterium suzukii TaxID=1259198 RepID=A0A4V3IT19_9MICO|nr:low molecular weight phosphatase family protein [Cryobacterium suzukii]TFD63148.1 low molecular weight phosphatase family protein [Cryobacterium suzukii]
MVDFAILTVCSGNICRSPMAEQLLRAGLAQWPHVSVASSGTIGLTGERMTEQAAALSHQFGGDPSGHVARKLTAQQINAANLVFAMSREHRRAVAELVPRAVRYTFTIREFARLIGGVTESDLGAAAALPVHDATARFCTLRDLAASQRGVVALAALAEDDDVVDPYSHGDDVYAESARQLVPAVESVLSLFRLSATVTRPSYQIKTALR